MIAAILLCASIAVIDGDTFRCGPVMVRIATIDAPELHTAKCDAERRLAEVAKARLDSLLAGGAVSVEVGDPASGREKDRHGRTLGVAKAGGKDIGAALVAERLARRWTGKRRPWCN